MFAEIEMKKVLNIEDIDIYRNNCIDFLETVINQFIKDKHIFQLEDFTAISYDEYILNTACHKDVFMTFYLEINQPSNYKPSKIKIKKEDKIRLPELYYSLEKTIEELYNICIRNLNQNNIVWYDENSISIKSTELLTESESITLYFRIIPALTYYNKENCRGVMYKSNGGVEIEYPLLSIDNFFNKNKATKDVYRQTVAIFKNIILNTDKHTTRLPKEIIEILLYNAPNVLFKDTSKKSLLALINYLRNNSIKSYKTMDEQDYAFSSPYRSLSPIYVKHILKLIEKYLVSN